MDGVKYLQGQNLEVVLGNGKKNIYMFIDPASKKTKELFNNKIDKLKKEYTLHIFLFPGDSRTSKLETAYILSLPKDKRGEELEIVVRKGLTSAQEKKARKALSDTSSNIVKFIGAAGYIRNRMHINSMPIFCNNEGKLIKVR
jgi:hypothetical protein